MSDKHIRAVELLRQEISSFLSTQSNRTSLITVTGIELTRDWAKAKVLISIYPEETKGALDFLNRKREDVRDHLKSRVKLKRIPFITFEIDAGEKHRQHMDELVAEEKKEKKDEE